MNTDYITFCEGSSPASTPPSPSGWRTLLVSFCSLIAIILALVLTTASCASTRESYAALHRSEQATEARFVDSLTRAVVSHHDSTSRVTFQRDSVLLRDSIFVIQRGDTVSIDRWHIRERVSYLHDTVFVLRGDTLHALQHVTRQDSIGITAISADSLSVVEHTTGVLPTWRETLLAAFVAAAFVVIVVIVGVAGFLIFINDK